MNCLQKCGSKATETWVWSTSRGLNTAHLCSQCAKGLWEQWKHQPCMSSLVIAKIV